MKVGHLTLFSHPTHFGCRPKNSPLLKTHSSRSAQNQGTRGAGGLVAVLLRAIVLDVLSLRWQPTLILSLLHTALVSYARTHTALAVNVLHKEKQLLAKGPVKQSTNGVASVFAFLCQELRLSILDPGNLVLQPATRGFLELTAGRNQHFRKFLDSHVRKFLLTQAANRHDCHGRNRSRH